MQSPPALARLSPASFAFVMATGIVAVAARQQGYARAAMALFGLNVAAWIALWLLTVLRIVRHREHVLQDLRDHLRSPGFFTAVAATAVLASDCLLLEINEAAAIALAAFGFVLWFVLTYGVFGALITKDDKPPLERGIGGGWLLAVVACQSISVICALLSAHFVQPGRLELNFVALSMWLFAGMLYTWVIALIFYRYLFFPFAPSDLAPPYWINMGAMAISTLAGAQLVANAPQAPFLEALLPFLKGFTILYWATGTWWLPMLVALTAWRYLLRRDGGGRDALDWSAVFPLGMYSAATHQVAVTVQLGFLEGIAMVFFWLAVLAWGATGVAKASALKAHPQ